MLYIYLKLRALHEFIWIHPTAQYNSFTPSL